MTNPIDAQAVKHAARGRMVEILTAAGIPSEALADPHHEHPCPKCGGETRFRFIDQEDGAVRCSHCFATGCGDVLAAVGWIRGIEFREAVAWVANFLKLGDIPNGHPEGTTSSQPSSFGSDPLGEWAAAKSCPRDSLAAFGATVKQERGSPVLWFPVYDEHGNPERGSHTTGGFVARFPGDKGKFLKGAKHGLFLPRASERPQPGGTIYVVEGVKDAAALHGLGCDAVGLPSCKLNKRFVSYFRGYNVVFVPDRDKPSISGFQQAAKLLSGVASSVRVANLPAPITESGGKDVRDILAQPDGERLVRDAIGQATLTEPSERRSQASLLADLASTLDLWHDDGVAFATLDVNGHHEHWPIRGPAVKRWLGWEFYRAHGTAPGAQALQDALTVLDGRAVFEGPERSVFVRVAGHGGNLYLDLGDAQWRVVEISASGWRVVDSSDCPVRFRRPKAILPLPTPTPGGDIGELRRFVNVSDGDWPLLLAWLVAAFRDVGPYPILALHGEQGSAKSTTARTVRSVIDPNAAPLRCEPRDARDLMIAANNGRVISLDNLSHIPTWLSDALCRLSTGGAFACRALYENAEETIFSSQRPIILTGIEELASRSDLLDRSLILHLPRIPEDQRRTESQHWREFEEAHPRILGAFLTAVSAALHDLPGTHLDSLPRMADFALWANAAERGLGLQPGDFMAEYGRNRGMANDVALESTPISRCVLQLAENGDWHGTASELLECLELLATDQEMRLKTWPKSPNALSGKLRRIAPNLRAAAVEVEFGADGRDKQKRRQVAIRKSTENIVPVVPIVPNPEKTMFRGDDGDDTDRIGDDPGTQFAPDENTGKTVFGDGGDDGDDELQSLSGTSANDGDWGEL